MSTRPDSSAQAADESERQLLSRVARADRVAFEALYRGYHPRLTRFLMRVTRQQDSIDDVVNDTFWLVWGKAGEFRGDSRVSTWIFGIAYRCALRALRRDRVTGTPLDDLSLEEPSTPGPQVDAEMQNWLGQALDQLTLDQRTTLQLAYYLGHSLEEISAIMDCPVSTVKARMFHARVKLRALLPALGGLDEEQIRASLG